jgi:hypothetical protein
MVLSHMNARLRQRVRFETGVPLASVRAMEQLKSLLPSAVSQFVSSLSSVKPADVVETLKQLPTGWKIVTAYAALWSLFRIRRIMNKKDIRGAYLAGRTINYFENYGQSGKRSRSVKRRTPTSASNFPRTMLVKTYKVLCYI